MANFLLNNHSIMLFWRYRSCCGKFSLNNHWKFCTNLLRHFEDIELVFCGGVFFSAHCICVKECDCMIHRENQVLWREVASLRQMHMKQQHVVSKVNYLLFFLVSLMINNIYNRPRSFLFHYFSALWNYWLDDKKNTGAEKLNNAQWWFHL